jgi:hypothetical protein
MLRTKHYQCTCFAFSVSKRLLITNKGKNALFIEPENCLKDRSK